MVLPLCSFSHCLFLVCKMHLLLCMDFISSEAFLNCLINCSQFNKEALLGSLCTASHCLWITFFFLLSCSILCFFPCLIVLGRCDEDSRCLLRVFYLSMCSILVLVRVRQCKTCMSRIKTAWSHYIPLPVYHVVWFGLAWLGLVCFSLVWFCDRLFYGPIQSTPELCVTKDHLES